MIKKRIVFSALILLAAVLFVFVFTENKDVYQAEKGDFLFQDLDCGPTCDAIEAVTWGRDSAKFSHIGFVVENKGELRVLEAISKGVVLTPISEFLARSADSNGSPKVWVGRVKNKYEPILNNVFSIYKKYLGIDYDNEFIYNNGKYYCSELIYDIFKEANNGQPFFSLEPMTFKSIKTGEFFPVWIDYYKKMNIPIPQDSLGINPAGISRSKKIEIVKRIGKVQR